MNEIRQWAFQQVVERYLYSGTWPPKGWEDITREADQLRHWMIEGSWPQR